MNRKLQRDVSRLRDGQLGPRRAGAVRRALAESAELAGLEATFREIGDRVRDQPVSGGRAPEAVWQDVQRAIRLGGQEAGAAAGPVAWPRRWAAGALTAVAGAVVIGWMLARNPVAAAVVPVEVEFAGTELPGATTLVYQDQETGLTVIWVMEEDRRNHGDAES